MLPATHSCCQCGFLNLYLIKEISLVLSKNTLAKKGCVDVYYTKEQKLTQEIPYEKNENRTTQGEEINAMFSF